MSTGYRPLLESLLGNSTSVFFSFYILCLHHYKVVAVDSNVILLLSEPKSSMGRFCFQTHRIALSVHSHASFATPCEMLRAKTYTHTNSSYSTLRSHKERQLPLFIYGSVSPPNEYLQKLQTNLTLMSRGQALDQHREKNLEVNT